MSSGRNVSILIIDDEPAVRQMLRDVLDSEGYRVTEADDAARGLELQRAAPFDLIITDLYMPAHEGVETLRLFRDEFPATPIMAISGGSGAGETGPVRDARLFGVDAALTRPVSAAALLTAVRELLEQGDDD